MATSKPQRSPAEIEDIILRKIFCVTLAEATDADPEVVYLEKMAAVILREGGELLLSRNLMERVLNGRLSGNFAVEPPFPYLIGCYRRALNESKKIQSMKDNNLRSEMEIVTREAKKLAVSYCRNYLANPDLFANSDITHGRWDKRKGCSRLKKRNVSPILQLILAESCSGASDMYASSSSEVQSPPGFLDEFFKDSDFVSLDPIVKELYEDLMMKVVRVSVLGDFQPSLRALKYLVSLPVGAKALVSHKCWIPQAPFMNGRTMELRSILGPFFSISALPDERLYKSQPDIA